MSNKINWITILLVLSCALACCYVRLCAFSIKRPKVIQKSNKIFVKIGAHECGEALEFTVSTAKNS